MPPVAGAISIKYKSEMPKTFEAKVGDLDISGNITTSRKAHDSKIGDMGGKVTTS